MHFKSLFFKRACTNCKKSDGLENMISFVYNEINDPFIENAKRIKFSKGIALIEESYIENNICCDFCGSKNKFDFWDIKIEDKNLLNDTFPIISEDKPYAYAYEFNSYETIYYKYDFDDKIVIDNREIQMTNNNKLERGLLIYNDKKICSFIYSYNSEEVVDGLYLRLNGEIKNASFIKDLYITSMQGRISDFASYENYSLTKNSNSFLETINENIDKEFISLKFLGDTGGCEPEVKIEYLFYDLRVVGKVNIPQEFL